MTYYAAYEYVRDLKSEALDFAERLSLIAEEPIYVYYNSPHNIFTITRTPIRREGLNLIFKFV